MKTQLPAMLLFFLVHSHWRTPARRRPTLSANTKKPAFIGWLTLFLRRHLTGLTPRLLHPALIHTSFTPSHSPFTPSTPLLKLQVVTNPA